MITRDVSRTSARLRIFRLATAPKQTWHRWGAIFLVTCAALQIGGCRGAAARDTASEVNKSDCASSLASREETGRMSCGAKSQQVRKQVPVLEPRDERDRDNLDRAGVRPHYWQSGFRVSEQKRWGGTVQEAANEGGRVRVGDLIVRASKVSGKVGPDGQDYPEVDVLRSWYAKSRDIREAVLDSPGLRELYIHATEVDASLMEAIGGLANLERLSFVCCRWHCTLDSIPVGALQKLTCLAVNEPYSGGVYKSAVEFAFRTPSLRTVDLQGYPAPSLIWLKALSGVKHLEVVAIARKFTPDEEGWTLRDGTKPPYLSKVFFASHWSPDRYPG